MKKLFTGFLLVLLLSGLVFASDPVPEGEVFVNNKGLKDFPLGADLSSFGINLEEANTILVGPSQTAPYFNLYESSRWYRIAVLNNKVFSIFVSEAYFGKRFMTEEGIYLGMSMKKVKELFPQISFKQIEGWGYEADLDSGWKLLFSKMTDDAVVTSIYKTLRE